jgi:dinuclear metal center YbgI/SA1388 family protein
MIQLDDICGFLDRFAPPQLAEEWDNVGLLVGDRRADVGRIMTCLTITPASVAEAVDERADLIVTHHPLPFRPLKRLTGDTTQGRMLLDLIAAGTAVYSPHTAFDSAAEGINQRLAEGLGLKEIAPLVTLPDAEIGGGAGRLGLLDPGVAVSQVAAQLKEFLSVNQLQLVGDATRTVGRVAVACGSAGQFLTEAQQSGCELFVTGETNFHTCLEAEATGVALLLTGHFASERFAVEALADRLTAEFPKIAVWPSRRERDPLGWV